MKVKSLLVGMMACVALGACTNQDLVEGDGNQPLEGDAYVAVTISNPENSFGRAATDGGDEYGTEVENKVEGATFVFFDGTGNYITKVNTTLTFTNNSPQSEAVLVLKNVTVAPTSVVAFLNVPSGLVLEQSLTNLLADAGNYGFDGSGNFVMSNSVYKNGDNMQIATPIGDKIKNSEAEAIENPVQIYVERVLSKVKVSTSTSFVTESTTGKLDNADVTFQPVIQGWTVSGTNKETYILKNLETTDITDTWVWGNNRSFWSKDVNYTSFKSSQTEDLNFSSYTEEKPDFQYCLENTLTIEAYKGAVAYTHLLVTARIQNKNTEKYLDTFCSYNGSYWTENNLKIEFVNGLKGFKKDGNQAITTDDIEFVEAGTSGNKAYMAKAQFKENVNVDDAAKATLANKGEFMMYTDGKCYFWTPIEHFGISEETGSIGVVRNHVYVLSLNKISGMGTPIVDPTEPIIPEKPTDDNSYLAAQINILNWKIVKQDVDL